MSLSPLPTKQTALYCFFFPPPAAAPSFFAFFSSLALSINSISYSSLRCAYHCPACSTNTPTNTSARIVSLAANTLKLSSLPM